MPCFANAQVSETTCRLPCERFPVYYLVASALVTVSRSPASLNSVWNRLVTSFRPDKLYIDPQVDFDAASETLRIQVASQLLDKQVRLSREALRKGRGVVDGRRFILEKKNTKNFSKPFMIANGSIAGYWSARSKMFPTVLQNCASCMRLNLRRWQLFESMKHP